MASNQTKTLVGNRTHKKRTCPPAAEQVSPCKLSKSLNAELTTQSKSNKYVVNINQMNTGSISDEKSQSALIGIMSAACSQTDSNNLDDDENQNQDDACSILDVTGDSQTLETDLANLDTDCIKENPQDYSIMAMLPKSWSTSSIKSMSPVISENQTGKSCDESPGRSSDCVVVSVSQPDIDNPHSVVHFMSENPLVDIGGSNLDEFHGAKTLADLLSTSKDLQHDNLVSADHGSSESVSSLTDLHASPLVTNQDLSIIDCRVQLSPLSLSGKHGLSVPTLSSADNRYTSDSHIPSAHPDTVSGITPPKQMRLSVDPLTDEHFPSPVQDYHSQLNNLHLGNFDTLPVLHLKEDMEPGGLLHDSLFHSSPTERLKERTPLPSLSTFTTHSRYQNLTGKGMKSIPGLSSNAGTSLYMPDSSGMSSTSSHYQDGPACKVEVLPVYNISPDVYHAPLDDIYGDSDDDSSIDLETEHPLPIDDHGCTVFGTPGKDRLGPNILPEAHTRLTQDAKGKSYILSVTSDGVTKVEKGPDDGSEYMYRSLLSQSAYNRLLPLSALDRKGSHLSGTTHKRAQRDGDRQNKENIAPTTSSGVQILSTWKVNVGNKSSRSCNSGCSEPSLLDPLNQKKHHAPAISAMYDRTPNPGKHGKYMIPSGIHQSECGSPSSSKYVLSTGAQVQLSGAGKPQPRSYHQQGYPPITPLATIVSKQAQYCNNYQTPLTLNSSGSEDGPSPPDFFRNLGLSTSTPYNTPIEQYTRSPTPMLPTAGQLNAALLQAKESLSDTDLDIGRQAHNAKERARRARIKLACEHLRELVPGMTIKTDKATVFEFAVQYIAFLRRFVDVEYDKEFMLQCNPY